MKKKIAVILSVAILVLICPVRLLWITSGSMEPALKTGSIHFVNRFCSMDDISPGDIVVFTVQGSTKAAHRVVEVHPKGLVTKGDANESPDLFLVTKDNFYGRITPWKNVF